MVLDLLWKTKITVLLVTYLFIMYIIEASSNTHLKNDDGFTRLHSFIICFFLKLYMVEASSKTHLKCRYEMSAKELSSRLSEHGHGLMDA